MTARLRNLLATAATIACVLPACAAPARCPDLPWPDQPASDPTASKEALRNAPPLFLAIEEQGPSTVKELLARGERPNACFHGNSLLSIAALLGYARSVQSLLDGGADPNSPLDTGGTSALMHAIDHSHFDIAQTLLAHGADARRVSDGGLTSLLALTALVIPPDSPAHAQQLALGSQLLHAGVCVDSRMTVRGTTALMQSALRGDAAMVRLLLDDGADASLRNAAGISALDFARKSGKDDVVAMVEAALTAKP